MKKQAYSINMQKNKVKTYEEIEKAFSRKLKRIIPIAKKYEKQRRIVVGIAFSSFILIWIIIFNTYLDLNLNPFYVRFAPNITEANPWAWGMLALPLLLIPLACFMEFIKAIEFSIKKQIMPRVCKCIGNLSWKQGSYKNPRILASAKIIRNDYDDVIVDDVFEGEHRGVKIEIVDARYVFKSGKGSQEFNITCFWGAFVVLKMNKKFKGKTVIKPDGLMKFDNFSLKRTELEDVVFEKKYDVYTNNEIEARYLITPSFMERLNEMKTAFKTNKVICSFHRDQLIIAFDTGKDPFNLVSLFKSTDNPKLYSQMFDEFLSIVKLIDYFKLDEKIGL